MTETTAVDPRLVRVLEQIAKERRRDLVFERFLAYRVKARAVSERRRERGQ